MPDILSSSTHSIAPPGVISRRRSFRDMTNEVEHGKCSACGHVDPKEMVQCAYDDILCPPCVTDYKGRPHCADHIREHVGDETMFFVLYGLSLRSEKSRITKAAAIAEKDAKEAFGRLVRKQYIDVKDHGRQEVRLTSEGRLALDAMGRAYAKLANVQQFIMAIGGPRK